MREGRTERKKEKQVFKGVQVFEDLVVERFCLYTIKISMKSWSGKSTSHHTAKFFSSFVV